MLFIICGLLAISFGMAMEFMFSRQRQRRRVRTFNKRTRPRSANVRPTSNKLPDLKHFYIWRLNHDGTLTRYSEALDYVSVCEIVLRCRVAYPDWQWAFTSTPSAFEAAKCFVREPIQAPGERAIHARN
jgi:hypothetical protein